MSEKSEAKRDGARLQKNSGRGKFAKGDAKWKSQFLIDYKEYAKSYSVSIDNWAKICSDAATVGPEMIPTLKVILGSGQEKVRLAVVAWEDFEEFVESWEREYGLDE